MKRGILMLLVLSLFCTSAYALTLHSTEMPGENPSVYGSIIAFETHEDHAGKDLNEDSDTADRVIQYYDTEKKTTTSTKTTGRQPLIFAYYIVFETSEREEGKDLNDDEDKEDTIFQYYNIHEQKTINTKIEAQNLFLFQYLVVFSTSEKAAKTDYNNDGDKEDRVIAYYDLKTQELTITNQIGDYPSTNGKRILFLTDESEVKIDLNDDGDEDDKIFQVYSLQTKTGFSTKTKGTRTTMNKNGIAAYLEGNDILLYDVEGNEKKETGIKADNSRIKENFVLYDYDNRINAYNLNTKTKTLTDIYGQKADLFEQITAFQTDEEYTGDLNKDLDQKDTIIRYAFSEDEDDDRIPDLTDNCPTISNINQADIDDDGMGDECDSKIDIEEQPEPKQEIQPQETTAPEPKQPEKQAKEKSSKAIWFGIIILLLIVITAAILILPGYYKRKKKSFGF